MGGNQDLKLIKIDATVVYKCMDSEKRVKEKKCLHHDNPQQSKPIAT